MNVVQKLVMKLTIFVNAILIDFYSCKVTYIDVDVYVNVYINNIIYVAKFIEK